MSSRQEEKERRRLKRVELERAEAAAAKRRRLLMVAGGAGVAAVAVVGIVLAVSSGESDAPKGPSAATGGLPAAAIPARKVTKLQEAVKAAGCTLRSFPEEGREHIADNEVFNGYKTNPPTSGTHHQTPAQDGIYDAGNEPAKESWVHTLEHGRIILQYKPGTPKRTIGQLQTLFDEKVKGGPSGYHMVLLQNNSSMTGQVAAVAWRNSIVCNTVDDQVWDAFRAFRDARVDKAPELVP